MVINNYCSTKSRRDKVNKALLDFCNNIEEYDYYDLYKYILQEYKLYLFYDPYKDEYYISDDWCLLI